MVGPFGKTCNQVGGTLNENFYKLILEEIRSEYINQERLMKLSQEDQALAEKNSELTIIQSELQKRNEAKRRAELLYLEGTENAELYRHYKAKYDQEIATLESQIRVLEKDVNAQPPAEAECRQKYEEFFARWEFATNSEEKNSLFSSIISRIWYNRETRTSEITIKIEYI